MQKAVTGGKEEEPTTAPWRNPPKESEPLFASDLVNIVGGGGTATVLTYNVPPGKVAYLKHIGHAWFANSIFIIRFDGTEWQRFNFQLAPTTNMYEFPRFAKRLYISFEFVVINNGVPAQNYDCRIDGWEIPQTVDTP